EVPYIISDEERAAFKNLTTDEERENFIESFWERRNPDPGSPENEFKEEYYRRIAYANEHFSSGVPGWKTDRGRIYIMYGPPDEIDPHPSGGTYNRTPEEGGGRTVTYPFEHWRYRYIENIGENVVLEFVDPSGSGEYHLAYDPGEKDALTHVPGVGLTQLEAMNLASKADRFTNTDGTTLGQPLGIREDEFSRLDRYYRIFKAPDVKYKDLQALVTSRLDTRLLPFDVREDFIRVTEESVLMPVTLQVANRDLEFVDKSGVMHASLDVFGQISSVGGKVVSRFADSVALDVPKGEFARFADMTSAYQKSVPLRPGLYKLTVVVKDTQSGKAGSLEVGTRVPHYLDEQLSSSSLILADVVQPLPTRQVGSGPFVIGGMKVRPSVTRTFTRNQNLGLYLQVYNLGIDPATRRPSVEVHYDIVKDGTTIVSKDENPAQLPTTSQEIVLAKTLPLKSLQPGKYTIAIRVRDKVRKQTVTPTETFELR
ncbi:MAG: GWxTD domain-containing protein, partial [Acidobacteriia bacterium]|nr:GWxTD domain-containing protein [Terriglobia bacterium]